MLDYGLKHIFRFYDDIEKQNYKKRWCLDDVCTFKLFTNTKRLLPFQIKRISSPNVITIFKMYCHDGTNEADILSLIPSSSTFYIKTLNGYDYIVYNGIEELNSELPCGDFYLLVSDGDTTWYSEIFTVRDFTDNEEAIESLRLIRSDREDFRLIGLIDKLKIN